MRDASGLLLKMAIQMCMRNSYKWLFRLHSCTTDHFGIFQTPVQLPIRSLLIRLTSSFPKCHEQ